MKIVYKNRLLLVCEAPLQGFDWSETMGVCQNGLARASNGTIHHENRRLKLPQAPCVAEVQHSDSWHKVIVTLAVGTLGAFVVFQLFRSLLRRKDYLLQICFKRELEMPFEVFT